MANMALPLSAEVDTRHPWKGKKIVIAEDNPTSKLYFKVALSKTGAEVKIFEDGLLLMDYLNTHPRPDVILMDIHIPGMNGLEATSVIKKTWPEIPVIVQSAYYMNGEEVLAYEAGCNDFLVKPIHYEALLTSLEQYLGPRNDSEQKK